MARGKAKSATTDLTWWAGKRGCARSAGSAHRTRGTGDEPDLLLAAPLEGVVARAGAAEPVQLAEGLLVDRAPLTGSIPWMARRSAPMLQRNARRTTAARSSARTRQARPRRPVGALRRGRIEVAMPWVEQPPCHGRRPDSGHLPGPSGLFLAACTDRPPRGLRTAALSLPARDLREHLFQVDGEIRLPERPANPNLPGSAMTPSSK